MVLAQQQFAHGFAISEAHDRVGLGVVRHPKTAYRTASAVYIWAVNMYKVSALVTEMVWEFPEKRLNYCPKLVGYLEHGILIG